MMTIDTYALGFYFCHIALECSTNGTIELVQIILVKIDLIYFLLHNPGHVISKKKNITVL